MATKKSDKEDISKTVLYAVGLSMGVAGVVLSFLNISLQTIVTLLSIGVFCLGLAGLDSLD